MVKKCVEGKCAYCRRGQHESVGRYLWAIIPFVVRQVCGAVTFLSGVGGKVFTPSRACVDCVGTRGSEVCVAFLIPSAVNVVIPTMSTGWNCR